MPVRSLQPAPRGFHGDAYLLRLVEALAPGAEVFVETGANVGSTLGDVVRRYPHLECFSCEPDPDAFAVAHAHATVRAGVHVFEETSQEFLRRFECSERQRFDQPLLAWLDAHDYGFEWPLREEVSFLTGRFTRGAILIDDFQVPGQPEFGWDQYDGRSCSFDYIESSISDSVAYRLSYPSYSEHTSRWHPLRGWGLLQFAPTLEELPDYASLLPDVCRVAQSREAGDVAPQATAPLAPEEVDAAIAALRERIAVAPEDPIPRNDLGVLLTLRGEYRAALSALAGALNVDPTHVNAAANYRDIAQAEREPNTLPLPIAPGRSGRMVARDPYIDLAHLLDEPAPLIVDGGANQGQTVGRLRGLFPNAAIHAFEPIPELCDAMRARFAEDSLLTVHAAALSDSEGELEFEVRAESTTSSMLKPSALKRRYQGGNVESVRTVHTLKRRLDRVFQEPVDVLKLDLQGHEIAALEGAGPLLSTVKLLLTEVEFTPLYEGQPLFADVDAFLRARGFRLFNLYELWCHPDGQITAGDALYVNERYFQ